MGAPSAGVFLAETRFGATLFTARRFEAATFTEVRFGAALFARALFARGLSPADAARAVLAIGAAERAPPASFGAGRLGATGFAVDRGATNADVADRERAPLAALSPAVFRPAVVFRVLGTTSLDADTRVAVFATGAGTAGVDRRDAEREVGTADRAGGRTRNGPNITRRSGARQR